MSEKSINSPASEDIATIAERAERGEDVSAHFTNRHVAKQRVNIDFPLALLRQIDAERQRVGVTRQAWIKMACDERLRQVLIAPETHEVSGDSIPSTTYRRVKWKFPSHSMNR